MRHSFELGAGARTVLGILTLVWVLSVSASASDPAIPGIVPSATNPDADNFRRTLMAVSETSVRQSTSPPPGPTLTLDDVLRRVDANHPKLRGADAERRIASAKRLEKQGAFDPVAYLSDEYLRFNSTTGRGKPSEAFQNEASVEFLTRYGLKFFGGVRYNIGKVKSPLSFSGDAGEYFFGLKLPLLRGARINEKSAGERQARLGEPLADAEFLETRLELLLKAANNYWDWVAAKRKLDVARNLLSIAQIRAEAIRERADLGDLPPIDKIEAEQEVRRREGGLVKADRDLQKATFKLSLFLWDDAGAPEPLPSTDRVPGFFPTPTLIDAADIREGRDRALRERPELKSLALQRDIARIDVDLARNQRLPAIDLTVSPGRDAGFQGIGTTLKAGVSITFPLRQRTADGRIAAGRLKIQKLNFSEQNERFRILTEVDDAVSAVTTARDRYLAAEQEFQLATVLERGERDRFALGDGTLFLVNQRERATAEAAVKMIEIQAEYEQARAAFRAATVRF